LNATRDIPRRPAISVVTPVFTHTRLSLIHCSTPAPSRLAASQPMTPALVTTRVVVPRGCRSAVARRADSVRAAKAAKLSPVSGAPMAPAQRCMPASSASWNASRSLGCWPADMGGTRPLSSNSSHAASTDTSSDHSASPTRAAADARCRRIEPEMTYAGWTPRAARAAPRRRA
jgi:hypothetical protein